jgi:prepilin-type N-terminal cleavage/methylation domain-containing protein
MKKIFSAFTLIELLVSIVIIGILATVSIATYNNYISNAKIAKNLAELSQKISKLKLKRIEYRVGNITAQEIMEADLDVVAKAIYIGREKEKSTLIDITGQTCSDCVCRDENFISPLSADAQTCVTRWDEIMTILKNSTDIDISFLETDPWGSPYLVDENEGEPGHLYCRKDTLFSAGPDQIHEAIGEDAIGDGYSIRLDYYDTAQCGS